MQDYGGLSGVPFLYAYDGAHQILKRDPVEPLFTRDPAVPGSPRLSKGLFIATFRNLLRRAGLPAESFSGHSFRAGGATDLFHGYCRPHMLQQQGRWRSDTFWIYVRDHPSLRREEVSNAFARMTSMCKAAPVTTTGQEDTIRI
jgi:integrase